jgi:hypothetical protein
MQLHATHRIGLAEDVVLATAHFSAPWLDHLQDKFDSLDTVAQNVDEPNALIT